MRFRIQRAARVVEIDLVTQRQPPEFPIAQIAEKCLVRRSRSLRQHPRRRTCWTACDVVEGFAVGERSTRVTTSTRGVPPKYRLSSLVLLNAARSAGVAPTASVGLMTSSIQLPTPPDRMYCPAGRRKALCRRQRLLFVIAVDDGDSIAGGWQRWQRLDRMSLGRRHMILVERGGRPHVDDVQAGLTILDPRRQLQWRHPFDRARRRRQRGSGAR